MIELKVKTNTGGESGTVSVDEEKLGGKIKKRLMHTAVLMYHANARQGSASTRNRGEIAGSTKKLYRQKGTGRARAGTRKSGVRVGGGRIFGPKPRDFGYSIPKKMRRAAYKSALLAKIKDNEVVVVENFGLSSGKTRDAAKLIASVGLTGATVMLATADDAREVYLAARNLANVTVKRARDLNALDLLKYRNLLIEQSVFEALVSDADAVKADAKAKETKSDEPKAEEAKDEDNSES
ncbi:MAG: 50S ribosomal protein L4 [Planctomycetota bacterium]|nr:50S ribosomal protein L4 [Planctomycetota bacterium]